MARASVDERPQDYLQVPKMADRNCKHLIYSVSAR